MSLALKQSHLRTSLLDPSHQKSQIIPLQDPTDSAEAQEGQASLWEVGQEKSRSG